MIEGAKRFFNSIDDAENLSPGGLIDLFVYYLTVEAGEPAVTARGINDCFHACDLSAPARTRAHLSEGLKSEPQRFVRVDGGYKLQHHYREALSKKLGAERVVVQASAELRKLESMQAAGVTRDDFGDIPEGKFIELLRASGIISNDVRKILDQKLGTRNSCAHPSGISINRSKVIDFVEDVIENVILKYSI